MYFLYVITISDTTSLPCTYVSVPITVQKVSRTVLPVRGTANLFFGQGSFIVGFKDTNELILFGLNDNEYKIMWRKMVPEGLAYSCYKHVSPSKELYLQLFPREASEFNGELELQRKLSTPGTMIGLLAGGKLAVVKDNASPGTDSSVVRLSVAPVDSLHEAHYRLDVPRDGPYTRQDTLYACGLADGRVAVTSFNKPFVDIYDNKGE